MKIRMGNTEIEVQVYATSTTPQGGNYWTTAYLLDEVTLASIRTGPSHQPPAPLDLLDATKIHTMYDYDSPDSEEHVAINWNGEQFSWKNTDPHAHRGFVNDRKCAWCEVTYTIRQKLSWAIQQVVND